MSGRKRRRSRLDVISSSGGGRVVYHSVTTKMCLHPVLARQPPHVHADAGSRLHQRRNGLGLLVALEHRHRQRPEFGFVELISNGVPTYIDVNDPLTASFPQVNQVLGINKSLNAVGFYHDQNGLPHGYLYSVSTAKFFPVNVAGAVSDSAFGINQNNRICGAFTKMDGHTDGFLKSATSGKTITFHVPGFTNTQFLGVNDNGIAVGFYNDAGNIPHGVVYNSMTGTYVIVNDHMGVGGTTLNGINDKNQIVGFYTDAATNMHGLIVTGVK
jgi:hypothetical protein